MCRRPEQIARSSVEPVLTARELDVLQLLGDGVETQAIAATLGLSVHTVRGHVRSILQKLHAHSQLAAVVEAVRRGLLPEFKS